MKRIIYLTFILSLLSGMISIKRSSKRSIQEAGFRLDSICIYIYENLKPFDASNRISQVEMQKYVGKGIMEQDIIEKNINDNNQYKPNFTVRNICEGSNEVYKMNLNRDDKPDFLMNFRIWDHLFYKSVVILSEEDGYRIVYSGNGFFEGYFVQNDTIRLVHKNKICCLDDYNGISEFIVEDKQIRRSYKYLFLFNPIMNGLGFPSHISFKPIGSDTLNKNSILWQYPIPNEQLSMFMDEKKELIVFVDCIAEVYGIISNKYGTWRFISVKGSCLISTQKGRFRTFPIENETEYFLWQKMN